MKSYKHIFVFFFFGVATLMAGLAFATDIEYHPRLGAIPLNDDIRSALKKFPDVAACLHSGTEPESKQYLDAIDWEKIKSDGDCEVCLFGIFEKLGGPNEVKAWIARQGFEAVGPIEQGYNVTVLEKFGYDVSRDAFKSYKNPAIQGYWSLRGQYPKFPTNGFKKYLNRLQFYSQVIGVTWFPDGKLMAVRIFYLAH